MDWEEYYRLIIKKTKSYGVPNPKEVLDNISELAFLEGPKLKLIENNFIQQELKFK